jgi:hypothetical protein
MINSGTSTFLFAPDAVLIASSVPGLCACSRTTFLFIGRNGTSLCLECDAKRMMVAPTECHPTDDGPDADAAFQKAIV